jgi:deazaflavin-dependent oxidoreductase (nitroreductase family)
VTEDSNMTHARITPRTAPSLIRASNPLASRLLRLGLPVGPNGLLTVRGRTSGQARTAPVAVAEIDGRRYMIGAYGDVQWTRNLRAAGEADFTLHGITEHVIATELDRAEATEFFAETLPTFVGRLPWFGRAFARLLFGLAAREIISEPERAAAIHPVFEVRAAS